jgi:polyadenylate-binding protein 2
MFVWLVTPRSYAYVEFADKESVGNAVALNESLFHGRPIKVIPKRTNVPGMNRGRGRGGRGGFRGYPMYYPPPMPFYYGPVYRGGRGRGRGAPRGRGYAPY